MNDHEEVKEPEDSQLVCENSDTQAERSLDEEPQQVSELSEKSSAAPRRPWWRELLSWLLHIVIVVIVVYALNSYIACLICVQGDSMTPSLSSGDYLVVSRLSAPERGSVIVLNHNGAKLVKRVIATEGQTVLIDYLTNAVFVDNQLLDEPYINLNDDDPLEDYGWESEWVVPEGYVFVMGDNRNSSMDSREFGPVATDAIIGVELVRIPIGEWKNKAAREQSLTALIRFNLLPTPRTATEAADSWSTRYARSLFLPYQAAGSPPAVQAILPVLFQSGLDRT